ncbi:hypothetical protein BDU57DRAFT_515157 [Ampelomyces quisqualis]|uniref:Uncharacterized protein n=1 Tax=Ampelomyces quisqualis TaxID=50730 RepID=A0A6A5QU61_AMPQU|nr:hypothetical protein BDU57DRAFT_515157 [Ampelomyces quisqualis]
MMTMMLEPRLDVLNVHHQPQPHRQPQGQEHYYGHPKHQATKCWHTLHPSASKHTPLCPTCTQSQANAKMNAALKGLVAEGGLVPAGGMRDRRWQRAKLHYEIVQERQAKTRSRDQLREERQQTWDEAHQRFYSTHLQTTATFQDPAECPVCAMMVASFPTTFPRMQVAKGTGWWERPGGLVADHVLVVSTPVRRVRAQKKVLRARRSSVLRMMVQDSRKDLAETEVYRQAWEARYRTESVVRRKHGLGQEYQFEQDFWDAPISASLTHQYHQTAREEKRMAARRARGNAPPPKPPRSSLSRSERSDEIEMDEQELDMMWRLEELKSLERQATKVGEEVGYLYFVGEIDGLSEWKEDFLRSDRQLIYRKLTSDAGSESDIEDYKDSESDDEDSADEEQEDSGNEMDVGE